MAKQTNLSESKQKLTRELKDVESNNREIAKRINRYEVAIRNLVKKGEKYGVKKCTKGNAKIKNCDQNRIAQLGETGRYSAAEIKEELRLSITNKRIAQIFRECGYLKYTKKAKKPNLTPTHIQARL